MVAKKKVTKAKNPENVARGRKALNNGKNFERQIAKDMGGIRVGGMGDNALRKSYDCYTDTHVYECKRYKTKPSSKQIMDWLLKVRKRARQEKKIGVLCLRFGTEGKRRNDYWIIERIQDSSVIGGRVLVWYSNLFPNPHMMKYRAE